MAYIGLDLGSTYTKIALLENEQILHARQIPTPPPNSDHAIRYEVDAEQYFQSVLAALKSFERYGADGLLLSTQMHGYVLTDKDFLPYTPYVSWQDKLGTAHLEDMRKSFSSVDVAPSGVPLKGNLTLCSLWARMQEGFEIPDHLRFCTLGGYLIGRLTGNHVCHMTNAAPTGFADVRKGTWNRALIQKAGLDRLSFPQIISQMEPVGTWMGIPVYPDLGDQQVCAAGADLEPEHTLHVSIGTAGLIGMLSSEWGQGSYENRPWISPDYYLRVVSGLPGGWRVTQMKDELDQKTGHVYSEDKLWKLMAQPDTDDILPQNLRKGIYDEYRMFAQKYLEAAGKLDADIHCLAFSGGCAAKNPALRQAMEQTFRTDACHRNHDVMLGMISVIKRLEKKQ